jgi:signal transduction histidine kinase
VATVAPLAVAKGLPIAAEISPGLERVYTDQRRAEQIVLNLLSNAVKFTDRGRITVSCHREGAEAVIEVADTGAGIDPRHVEDIFKPFRQADSSLARKHEGTGLGLSICRRLVERLGGTISVNSTLGAGSTFRFTLPLELDIRRE